MKDREIACVHYKAEGSCDLGKDGTFRGHCQTCPSYSPLRHGRPARTDNRRQKAERIMRKERWDY